ncbi:MAG: hypothetical protein EBR82_07250 [Caulobacteraceae bacterium]|nr:hypothetical protein [Caulobacteraceae bacterium]
MIDSTWAKEEISDFGGEWRLIDQDDIPPERALRALNCSFIPGSVFVRNGFASAFNPNDIVNSMKHWLFGDASSSGKSYLIWHKQGYGVRLADLSAPSATDLYAVTGARGALFANAGAKFYAAHYNTSGVGVDGGNVYGNSIGADSLFARPMLTTEVTLTGGAPSAGGNCTEGTRKIGFIMTTRNGFTGRPAPTNTSLVLQATSVTTTSANKQFLVTVTPTTVWPAWAGSIQIIMTTTVDPATYYFVPGTVLGTPAGGGLAVSTTISISDDDLVIDAGVSDATKYFFLLTQDSSGVAPFNPSAVFNAGNRMAYVFRNSAYGQGMFISNPNQYQEISASRNLVYLPGQLQVTTGFYKDKVIYAIGDDWTYAVGDTGDDPSSWAAATCIDSSIGTMCPEGVSFDMARGIGWVAHTSGLYRFAGGAYDDMPASYMNSTIWNKINWTAAPYCLRVVDSNTINTVFVAAPMTATGRVSTVGTAVTWVDAGYQNDNDDFSTAWVSGQAITINGVSYSISSVTSRTALVLTGSAGTQTNVAYSVAPTYNTELLTWNYTKGDSVDTIKFSRWPLQGLAPSAITMVNNYTNKRQELWVGLAAAGAIYRQKQDNETNLYRDGSNPIDALYQSGLFANDGDGGTLQHHGADFRVRGSGTLNITASTLDGAQTATLSPITLATAPGREYFRGMRLISERAYYTISNANTLDAHFRLSLLRHYFTRYTMIR